MVNESNKIIVKVGNKSRVQFANSKVYRAITAKDLELIAKRHNDCNIVVIESISEDEQEEVREFARQFKESNEAHSVLFFIPENDDITSGIADELDYNIYLTLSDLYKYIYDTYDINVSILVDDRKRINSSEIEDNIPDGITDIFGGIGEDEESDIAETIKAIDDADNNADNSIEDNIDTDTEQSSADVVDEISTENNTDDTDEPVEAVINDTSDNNIAETNSEDVTTETTDESDSSDIEESANIETDEATSEYIEKLKMQLNDTKYDLNEAFKDMREANSKIDSLEEVIRAITAEKQDIIDKFNAIMVDGSILEDPISLADYSLIKQHSDELEAHVIELNVTIKNLEEKIESKDLEINSSETTIEELNNTVNEIKSKLKELNTAIDSGEIHKEVIEEYTDKLNAETKTKEAALDRVRILEDENSKLSNDVTVFKDRISKESDTRLAYQTKLQQAISKIRDLSGKLLESEKQIGELTNKLKEAQLSEKDSKSRITKLEKSVNDTDKKIELAKSESSSELIKLNSEIDSLKTQLQNSNELLEAKTEQYNKLVEASGVDENSAGALIESNKALEALSGNLREQLNKANAMLQKAQKDAKTASDNAKSYKTKSETLQKTLDSITNIGGMTSGVSIAPINSSSINSKIITVSGSGSYGITTTAMSLANRISATNRVLYIDFDLVSPMADAWFKKNPMINSVPGTVNRSICNSSLGIFIEHGIDTFKNNINKLIINVNTTKGGGLYYLSGLYYSPDTVKLMTADYKGLFEVLSSNFQYIIIDFGRLGSSEISDKLYSTIADISDKNIVVTTTNIFEVRNFTRKIDNINIDKFRIAWLFNMCESTALDANVKKLVDGYNYSLIPRMEFYGKQENFLRNTLTRERFNIFVDSYIFGA